MNILDRGLTSPSPTGGRDLAFGGNAGAMVTRETIGEIVQRVPADHYTLILRSLDLGGGRWRRCVIGDLPGHRVVETIEDGAMCLCLRDIGPLLRAHLGPFGHDFPQTTPTGQRLMHGLVVASGGLELTLSDVVGSGMVRALEGDIRLVFAEREIHSGRVSPEWAVNLSDGREFHWRAARPRRFETGKGLAIGLTRAVVPEREVLAPWRLDALAAAGIGAMRRLHRRIFGAPERWTTAIIGTAPIGGLPTLDERASHDADYRLVRRPSRNLPRG